jgi:predicted RNA-binding Zn-ribbon protein involved in translation (DUF1610 family)
MDREIKFVCSTCGQHIAVPQEAIGETVSCPTCGTENIVSSASATMLTKQKSHKFAATWILFAVVSCLAILVLLARLILNTPLRETKPEATATGQQPNANIVESSNPPVTMNETPPQPVLIEGLFGVKLGEPMPPSCKITDEGETDGRFIPPETNSVFKIYDAAFDALDVWWLRFMVKAKYLATVQNLNALAACRT